ncbi:serine hydrolase [Streptococcus pantholopis]|uniref:D-alanyl-D-alanine carboxypeptidase n=1 Tax=Streptococcus pantholopis TaxID=1811193 RepID=A0A172Q8F3_9STRE|nr:serine hydrolase [Streptococcus pantholopis]AND79697.1 D-alanyl-D-alanine carboxypeptidase [Streptococcus pantholopis]
MHKRKKEMMTGTVVCGLLLLAVAVVFLIMANQAISHSRKKQPSQSSSAQASSGSDSVSQADENLPVKTDEQKQAAFDADAATMEAYGLTYDYVHSNLVETVQAFLADQGIEPSQIAFSYKNVMTGETYAMNDTQPMTAGSTYKLPLNMLVVDAVTEGELSMTERFDITETEYEYLGEHDAYVAQFDGAMTIADMQEYSLVYSENTPAYALAERLGGLEKVYPMFNRYGESKADIKTIQSEGNKTTTDYYIQVLDYLWQHQEKYADILYYLEQSFPEYYYRTFMPSGVVVAQKPGYVREALNVDAIVYEETPYIVAIYTAGLGGSDETTEEVNNYGLYQLEALAYVINEWHRVNMNPALTAKQTVLDN